MNRILTIALILFALPSIGATHYRLTPATVQALADINSLKFTDSDPSVLETYGIESENLVGEYLENLREVLRIFTSQDESMYESYVQHQKAHVRRMEGFSGKDPLHRFLLADVHFHGSLIHAKFGHMAHAASDVANAYSLLKKNLEEYPDFVYSGKTLGLIEAALGTLPDSYRKLIGVAGFKGTIQGGMRKIESAIGGGSDPDYVWFKREAGYYAAMVELHLLNRPESAWNRVKQHSPDFSTNLLAAFIRANTAMKTGRNDEAISVLMNFRDRKEYLSFPFLDFMLGSAKLHRLDDDANVYLEQFLSLEKEGDYVKSCYNKLRWYYLVRENMEKYEEMNQYTVSRGSIHLEEDRQALEEALASYPPHPALLKTRLLYDGGYYERAELEIGQEWERNFDRLEYRIEYNYRKGRVYEKLGRINLAEAYYKETIDRGESSTLYYASYACLYLGQIYENRGEKEMARKQYKKAKEMAKKTAFRKSVEHKAKSGLSRLDQMEAD